MLNTSLKHITSEEEFNQVITDNNNVMICCGRMGPMCLPVYDIMERLQETYEQVTFYDLPFDSQFSHVIRNHPMSAGFMGLPFTYYFKNGAAVAATSSIQSKRQVKELLDKHFA